MTWEMGFRTDSIDLAAFLMTAGFNPLIFCTPDSRRAYFVFTETDDLLRAIVRYEGNYPLPAKRLLHVRSRLFRVVAQVVKEEASS